MRDPVTLDVRDGWAKLKWEVAFSEVLGLCVSDSFLVGRTGPFTARET